MTNFKIFLRDGKLFGNEFPEIPAVSISANQDAARMRSYNRAVESACGTAVMVIGLDESALILNGFACEDDFYSVPNGWTWEYGEQRRYETSCGYSNWYNTEPSWADGHKFESRKIARLVKIEERECISQFASAEEFSQAHEESKSPVIPEGSEKHDFCLPWTYQERADKYTHIIRGNSNQHLLQGRQRPDGYEEALFRMIVKAVNAYHSADKPAIDDTLKGKIDRIGELYESGKDCIHGISRFLLPKDDRERLDHLINVIRELRDIAAVEAKAAQPPAQAESAFLEQNRIWLEVVEMTQADPNFIDAIMGDLHKNYHITRKP
jgi:hypothetical protein